MEKIKEVVVFMVEKKRVPGKENYYCQQKCGHVDFSIVEWNKAYNAKSNVPYNKKTKNMDTEQQKDLNYCYKRVEEELAESIKAGDNKALFISRYEYEGQSRIDAYYPTPATDRLLKEYGLK